MTATLRNLMFATIFSIVIGIPDRAISQDIIATIEANLPPGKTLGSATRKQLLRAVSETVAADPEVAAVVAGLVPDSAPGVAGAVAYEVPESALEIAEAVMDEVPGSAALVAEAVANAVPALAGQIGTSAGGSGQSLGSGPSPPGGPPQGLPPGPPTGLPPGPPFDLPPGPPPGASPS